MTDQETLEGMSGLKYQRIKAIILLNRVINEKEEISPPGTFGADEKYTLDGGLNAEIFNFLQNNNIDSFT